VATVKRQPRSPVCAACLTFALAGAACTASGGSRTGPAADPGRPVIVVGSFDFPESILLAYLYADALAGRGYPVRVLPGLGTRELVDPALMTGLIQVVPEYTGSALEFVSLGRVRATASVAATAGALARAMAGRGLITGRPAAAQDGNAIVVTALDAVSARLSTAGLAALDTDVELGNGDPRTVAERWLRAEGLAGPAAAGPAAAGSVAP
jgi:osmoprotectant transport system substrate-binding protein